MGRDELSAADRRLMDRILWRIMPLLVVCLVVSAIEKSNIGFAKLGMLQDVGLTEAVFALGSSLFYVGYVLFEIPSAMGNYRYGAKIWFARIMVTWAITTLLLIFTQSAWLFYVLRFALGAAEAGLYPSLIFVLTLWFPQSQRARALGYLTVGSAAGNGLSAVISGSLLELDGTWSLAGWQWVFLVTGALPLVTTALVLAYLPSKPSGARFLTREEQARVTELAGSENPDAPRHNAWSTLLEPRTFGYGLLYAILLGSLYGMNYWMPTVLNQFGVTGRANGLLIGIPWAIDAILLVLIMPRLKSARAVSKALVVLSVMGIGAFFVGAFGESLLIKSIALLLGVPAVSLGIACFWTVPVRHFTGAHAAAAIGAISMFGNIGGVASLNAMPAIAAYMGDPAKGLLFISLGMCVIAVWAFALLRQEKGQAAEAR